MLFLDGSHSFSKDFCPLDFTVNMLDFTVNTCSFHVKDTLFYHGTLIFVQSLLFLVIASHFSQYWSCNWNYMDFFLILVSLFPDLHGKRDMATHDGIAPFPWKHWRFYIKTFCILKRRDQGLIVSSLGLIKFIVF